MRGMEEGLRGDSVQLDPGPLQRKIAQLAFAQPTNAGRMSLALRLKINEATPVALRMVSDTTLLEPDRKMLVAALADLHVNSAVPVFLDLLQKDPSESLRSQVLGSLPRFSRPEIPTQIMASYAGLPHHLQLTAQGVLASRSDWAAVLLDAVDSGRIQPDQISEVTLAAIRKHGNPRQSELIGKYLQSQEQKKAPAGELQRIVQLGEQSYRSRCSYCHLASGQGMKKSLVSSKWIQGTDGGLIRILLQGKQGETEVMPGFGAEMDDMQIASLLTYVRRQWGNQTQPVESATVREVRSATADRKKPWTEDELLTLMK